MYCPNLKSQLGRSIIFLVFLFTSIQLSLIAQIPAELVQDSLLYVAGRDTIRKGDTQAGLEIYLPLVERLRRNPAAKSLLRKSLGNLSSLYLSTQDGGAGEKVAREAYNLGVELLEKDDYRTLRYLRQIGEHLIRQTLFDKAEVYFLEAKARLETRITAESLVYNNDYNRVLFALSVYYIKVLELSKAEATLDLLDNRFLGVIDNYSHGLIAYNRGELHRYAGRYEEALFYLEKAQELWQSIGAPFEPERFGLATRLILTNLLWAEFKPERILIAKSLVAYAEELAMSENGVSQSARAVRITDLGLLLDRMREHDRALILHRKAVALSAQLTGEEAIKDNITLNLVSCLQSLKRYEAAAEIINNFYKKTKELKKGRYEDNLRSISQDLQISTTTKNREEVLRALTIANENFNPFDPERLSGSFSGIINYLASLGQAYNTLADLTENPEQKISYHETCLRVFQVLNQRLDSRRRIELVSVEEHRWINQDAKAWYGTAISSCNSLAGLTSEQAPAEYALELIERTRYNKLLDQWIKFNGYTNEPSWREEERSLLFKIQQFEPPRLESGIYDATPLNSMRGRLFDLRDSVRRNGDLVERPDYYRVNVNQIREGLAQNERVLDFFTTPAEQAFCVKIEKDSVRLFELPANTNGLAKQFVEAIKSPFKGGKSLPDDKSIHTFNNVYWKVGPELYANLINQLGIKKGDRLIIAADGELNKLPFDALPRHGLGKLNPLFYHRYPYLSDSITTSYTYSLALKAQMDEDRTSTSEPEFLGVVPFTFKNKPPVYEGTEAYLKNLKPLNKGNDFLAQILDYFPGKKMLYPHANKRELLAAINDFSVLYLNSHAGAINAGTSYEQPYLVMTDSRFTREGLLYADELARYHNNLDFVYLNACSSGVGYIDPTEGMMSLGMSFAHSGAKSIVATLWPVFEEPSGELAVDFFRNLSEKQTKDSALRNAQRQYLAKNTHLESHPYFWAGTVIYGNLSALR